MGFVIDIIRSLLFFFDQIIYGFIPVLYDFIELLALQTLFPESAIEDLAGNIYAILGVFMLFRLAFVLLNAIIDPDKLTDKNKGFGKMLTRAVVALVLIVAVPWAFSFAFRLQAIIIENGLIGKIILGTDGTSSGNPGQQMGRLALGSFLTCNEAAIGVDESGTPGGGEGTSSDCQTDLKSYFAEAFPDAGDGGSFEKLSDNLNEKVKQDNGDEVYKFSYTAGISTVAGVFILGMLIVFVFDIAARVIKLGFLQLLSPVAIIGYIEPDGGIFNRWLKISITTYINLFVRIVAVTFVIYVLSLLGTAFTVEGVNDASEVTKGFVKIFIIFGALLFANEAPKMIKNMFNLSEESIGTLNPMKKLGSVPLVGGAAVAGIGLGAAAGAHAVGSGVGALSGGLGAKLRGGTFAGGARAGAEAAGKKIPISSKTKLGSLAPSVLGGIGAGAMAGYGSDVAKEAALKNQIAKAGGDVGAIFTNEALRQDYNDFAAKKADVKAKKSAVSQAQNRYTNSQLGYRTASDSLQNANNRYSQSSQALAAAKTSRDAALARAAELKRVMDSSKPSNPSIISPTYSAAKREYDNYVANGGEYDRAVNVDYTAAQNAYTNAQTDLTSAQNSYSTARTEYETANTVLQTSTAGLATAERDLTTAETKFKTNLEAPENKKDADSYKVYKRANDTGRI